MHDHSHSHSHSHDHSSFGGWQDWRSDTTLRAVTIAVVLVGILTLVGIIALWPSAEGQSDAASNAEGLGLASERYSATVEQVTEQLCSYSTSERQLDCSVVTLRLHDGPDSGQTIVLPEVSLDFDVSSPQLVPGEDVIAGFEPATGAYFYADRERRGSIAVLFALFAVVVVALGRSRGVLALLAMALTVLVLVWFVAPSVLDGNDPLLVAVVAAAAIAFLSLYLTHGFNPTTTIALAGTLAALGVTLTLSWLFFNIMNFTGLATEEALILPLVSNDLDVRGLLLGGAIIGALGALDDVTVTQAATVSELRFRNADLTVGELVSSGIRIGREHIASTVNTLLLAYAGASVPLLLLFSASGQSLDIVANSELIAVEIVRTLGGSIGLVAAVPITTVLAAIVVSGSTSDATFGDESAEEETTATVATPGESSAAEPSPGEPSAAESSPAESSPGEMGPDGTSPEVIDASWDDFAPRDGDLFD